MTGLPLLSSIVIKYFYQSCFVIEYYNQVFVLYLKKNVGSIVIILGLIFWLGCRCLNVFMFKSCLTQMSMCLRILKLKKEEFFSLFHGPMYSTTIKLLEVFHPSLPPLPDQVLVFIWLFKYLETKCLIFLYPWISTFMSFT